MRIRVSRLPWKLYVATVAAELQLLTVLRGFVWSRSEKSWPLVVK
jgi:hypothetical protein